MEHEQERFENYLRYLDKPNPEWQGQTPPIMRENAELIREFVRNTQSLPKPPCFRRLRLLAIRLKVISHLVGKPLDKLTEEDIKTLNPKLRLKCPKSSSDYRKTLKLFWKRKNKKQFIDLLDSEYMKTPFESTQLVDADKFWSQKEIEAYIQESKRYSPRQLAWASIWLSSGCRPGEIFALKKKHIEYEELEGQLFLTIKVPSGKTGKRDVILKDQEAKAIWGYVTPYLNSLGDDDLLFPASYSMQKRIHNKICKRIPSLKDKDTIFYVARKWNVTRFYKELGMVEGAEQSGHIPGSGVMKHYVNMTRDQRKNGKLVSIQRKVCPNPLCRIENEAHLTQCVKCESPLDAKKYADLVQQQNITVSRQIEELVNTKLEYALAQFALKARDANGNSVRLVE